MKIHIIGCAGSGKTYLGKKLSQQYNCPVLDLDNIFWDKNADRYGTKTPKELRLQQLNEFLTNENYIIEGVYYKWLGLSFEQANKIIIFKTNIYLCTFRIITRFIKRKLGLIQNKKENLHDLYRLITWNFKYHREDMPLIIKLCKKYSNKTYIYKSGMII